MIVVDQPYVFTAVVSFGATSTHLVLEIAFVCDASMHISVSVFKASHVK